MGSLPETPVASSGSSADENEPTVSWHAHQGRDGEHRQGPMAPGRQGGAR